MSPSARPTPTTFPELLTTALRVDPARPLVTFYDDATGERIELSVTTYANWVAKTAALVHDQLDVEPGGVVLLDLPTHWLGAVWLGASWTAGLVVTTDPAWADRAELVVCAPAGVQTYAAGAAERPVVALSLRPLGARFADPLPDDVVDYGAEVLSQPDVFVPVSPPTGDDPAWQEAGRTLSQRQLVERAAAGHLVDAGGRLLTDVNPCTPDGVGTLLSPLLRGGGTVWVAHPDASRWRRRYDEERASAQLRSVHSS